MQEELDFNAESIAAQILLEAVKNCTKETKKEVLAEYKNLV